MKEIVHPSEISEIIYPHGPEEDLMGVQKALQTTIDERIANGGEAATTEEAEFLN